VGKAGPAIGPEVLDADDSYVRIRFRHHAPGARAVALEANCWRQISPADACDLRDDGEGHFSGVFEVPRGWTTSYGFVEHHGSGDPLWWEHGFRHPELTPVLDAGNPRRHGAGRGGVRSVARTDRDALTDACDAPADASVRSLPHRADEPVVTWWAPAGARRPLPLVVFFDGQAHADHLGTPGALARLIRDGALPPLAAVFVSVGREERASQLGVPGGQARWVAETLLPRLRREGLVETDAAPVAVTADPARTVVTGSSFGGLSTLFSLIRAPQEIGVGIAQSVSLWRYRPGSFTGPLLDAVCGAAAYRRGTRIRLQSGLFEGGTAARELADQLERAGGDARFRVVPGGHDWAWWQVEVLRELADVLG
jgi:enterochelin esterase family protein